MRTNHEAPVIPVGQPVADSTADEQIAKKYDAVSCNVAMGRAEASFRSDSTSVKSIRQNETIETPEIEKMLKELSVEWNKASKKNTRSTYFGQIAAALTSVCLIAYKFRTDTLSNLSSKFENEHKNCLWRVDMERLQSNNVTPEFFTVIEESMNLCAQHKFSKIESVQAFSSEHNLASSICIITCILATACIFMQLKLMGEADLISPNEAEQLASRMRVLNFVLSERGATLKDLNRVLEKDTREKTTKFIKNMASSFKMTPDEKNILLLGNEIKTEAEKCIDKPDPFELMQCIENAADTNRMVLKGVNEQKAYIKDLEKINDELDIFQEKVRSETELTDDSEAIKLEEPDLDAENKLDLQRIQADLQQAKEKLTASIDYISSLASHTVPETPVGSPVSIFTPSDLNGPVNS